AGARSVVHEVTEVDVTLGSDGGWLWTIDESSTVADLWGVSGNTTSIYAVGASGTILQRKGGGPWPSLVSGRTALLSTVPTIGDTVLVAGNLGCDVLRSTDGGYHFAPIDRCATGGMSGALLAIWGDPSGQAITCGGGYGMYHSDDAGGSWTPSGPFGGPDL